MNWNIIKIWNCKDAEYTFLIPAFTSDDWASFEEGLVNVWQNLVAITLSSWKKNITKIDST